MAALSFAFSCFCSIGFSVEYVLLPMLMIDMSLVRWALGFICSFLSYQAGVASRRTNKGELLLCARKAVWVGFCRRRAAFPIQWAEVEPRDIDMISRVPERKKKARCLEMIFAHAPTAYISEPCAQRHFLHLSEMEGNLDLYPRLLWLFTGLSHPLRIRS